MCVVVFFFFFLLFFFTLLVFCCGGTMLLPRNPGELMRGVVVSHILHRTMIKRRILQRQAPFWFDSQERRRVTLLGIVGSTEKQQKCNLP